MFALLISILTAIQLSFAQTKCDGDCPLSADDFVYVSSKNNNEDLLRGVVKLELGSGFFMQDPKTSDLILHTAKHVLEASLSSKNLVKNDTGRQTWSLKDEKIPLYVTFDTSTKIPPFRIVEATIQEEGDSEEHVTIKILQATDLSGAPLKLATLYSQIRPLQPSTKSAQPRELLTLVGLPEEIVDVDGNNKLINSWLSPVLGACVMTKGEVQKSDFLDKLAPRFFWGKGIEFGSYPSSVGFSGGPILNTDGSVVGIHVGKVFNKKQKAFISLPPQIPSK